MFKFVMKGGFGLGHSRCQINTTDEEGNEKCFLTSPPLQHDGYTKENAMDSENKGLNSPLVLLPINI